MTKNKENNMKDYQTPDVELCFLGYDVITASNPNDNDFEDTEDWD